jgi:hypothetical protein
MCLLQAATHLQAWRILLLLPLFACLKIFWRSATLLCIVVEAHINTTDSTFEIALIIYFTISSKKQLL